MRAIEGGVGARRGRVAQLQEEKVWAVEERMGADAPGYAVKCSLCEGECALLQK